MSAGLDSISATEFTRTLSERFDTELPPTLLFDHPSVSSVADWLVSTVADAPAFASSADTNAVAIAQAASPLAAPVIAGLAKRLSSLSSESLATTLPGELFGMASLQQLVG